MIEYNVGHVKWKLASHPPSGFFFGAPNTRFGEYGCFLVTRQKGVAVRRSFSFFFPSKVRTQTASLGVPNHTAYTRSHIY